jgi:hypothetical protein
MQTIPRIGLAKLASLRGKERLFHVAWGLARWLTVAIAVVAFCTFIDWRVDKNRETPFTLRVILTVLEAAALGIAGWFWLVKPWTKGPSLIRLARRVERGIPEFDHRLVTSIQLSRKKSTGGMSPELIETVARESEALSDKHTFGRFADYRRLKWSAALVGLPLLMAATMIFAYGPGLLKVLLQRQLLMSTEIPRFNKLENNTRKLWPAGDEVTVEYIVSGRIDEKSTGRLRVKPDDLPADEYQLEYTHRLDDDHTVFAARIPHSSVNFTHRAWIGDGRTKDASQVEFVPRPVVTKTDAWVRLPEFLGKKPDGGWYETYQSQGEITGLANSKARLRIAVQKKISEASLTLIARTKDGTGEVARQTIPMFPGSAETLPNGETEYSATVLFDLTSDLLAYSVEVKDENGFANATPPRRGIQIAPDEPPVVRLLPERYSEPGTKLSEEDIIEGLPIPLGGQVPIAYTCRSPQGVGRAQLRYRINERGTWATLPLKQVEATEKSGPFDPTYGTFANATYGQQVEFHAIVSPDRETMPDFLTGGGRFDFQTAELTKITEEGKVAKLEIGDRVEYYVEIYDRNPASGRPAGRSEARIKEVLSASEVLSRLDQTRQAESKIRDLEKKQRDVFGRKPDEK